MICRSLTQLNQRLICAATAAAAAAAETKSLPANNTKQKTVDKSSGADPINKIHWRDFLTQSELIEPVSP